MKYGVHSDKVDLLAEIGRHETERYKHGWKLRVLAMAMTHAATKSKEPKSDMWWSLFVGAVVDLMLDDPWCKDTSPESYNGEP